MRLQLCLHMLSYSCWHASAAISRLSHQDRPQRKKLPPLWCHSGGRASSFSSTRSVHAGYFPSGNVFGWRFTMGMCSAGVSDGLINKQTGKKNRKCGNLLGATAMLRYFLLTKKQQMCTSYAKSRRGCESVLHVLPVCRVHGRRVAVAPQHNGGGQDVQRGVKLQSSIDTQKAQTAWLKIDFSHIWWVPKI